MRRTVLARRGAALVLVAPCAVAAQDPNFEGPPRRDDGFEAAIESDARAEPSELDEMDPVDPDPLGLDEPRQAASDRSASAPARSWTWRLAPYFWDAGVEGTVRSGPGEIEFDNHYGNNLDDIGVGTFVEAACGPLGLLADAAYLELDLDGDATGGLHIDAETQAEIYELAALYRPWTESAFELGLGLGMRYVHIELDVSPIAFSADHDVFDGFAAARARWSLERWSLTLYGDVGAGDSDRTWQASGTVGLELGSAGLGLGYRALDYDVEEEGDELDLRLEGVTLGAWFRF